MIAFEPVGVTIEATQGREVLIPLDELRYVTFSNGKFSYRLSMSKVGVLTVHGSGALAIEPSVSNSIDVRPGRRQ